MSSTRELTSKKESIKILRAPGKKHTYTTKISFFGRLFRRRKQPCSIHETGEQDENIQRSATEDVAKREEFIEAIEREVNTCWLNEMSAGNAQRCKERKQRHNQRPKTPYKAQVVERLQDQSLGAYTESKSLGMYPAFSISNKGKSCDESTSDVLLPSTESDLPKNRKGALKETRKPIVAVNPVVNYTHGYQSDSDSASSSSSSESDHARPPSPPRTPRRPAIRSMPSICYSINRPDLTDEDRRRMHDYLNQFSSVHISRNLKDPIPKDPETLPGFCADMSRRRMAEALSKHGSTLFSRPQASSRTQNKKNAKSKKKKSWFFPATTGDVTMPGEETGAASSSNRSQNFSQPGRSTDVKHNKNASQVSTEVRCHDLTKKPTSSMKTLEKSDKRDEDGNSGSASGIGNESCMNDTSPKKTWSPQHRSKKEANTPMINNKKSYRYLHENSRNEVLADVARAADENLGKYLSPEEVERKEKMLGSVECDPDDHSPGVSNQSRHIVQLVLAGKTFCSEKDLEEKGPKRHLDNRCSQKENERLLNESSNLLQKVTTNSGRDIQTNFKSKKDGYTSSIDAAQHYDTDQLSARKKKAYGTRAEPRISHWQKRTTEPAPSSECNNLYTKYKQDTDISWERTSSPKSRQQSERSDLNVNSTLNWTIIMKHTPRKHEFSSTDSHDFT